MGKARPSVRRGCSHPPRPLRLGSLPIRSVTRSADQSLQGNKPDFPLLYLGDGD